MKILFAAVLAFGTTGCLGIEQANIQSSADEQNADLDTACNAAFESPRRDPSFLEYKAYMRDYCLQQRTLIAEQRNQDMAQASSNAQFRGALVVSAFRH